MAFSRSDGPVSSTVSGWRVYPTGTVMSRARDNSSEVRAPLTWGTVVVVSSTLPEAVVLALPPPVQAASVMVASTARAVQRGRATGFSCKRVGRAVGRAPPVCLGLYHPSLEGYFPP